MIYSFQNVSENCSAVLCRLTPLKSMNIDWSSSQDLTVGLLKVYDPFFFSKTSHDEWNLQLPICKDILAFVFLKIQLAMKISNNASKRKSDFSSTNMKWILIANIWILVVLVKTYKHTLLGRLSWGNLWYITPFIIYWIKYVFFFHRTWSDMPFSLR